MFERPMPFWISILIVMTCAGLLLFSASNLRNAAIAKGWLRGGQVRQAIVTDKGAEDKDHFWADWKTTQPTPKADPETYASDTGRTPLSKAQFDRVQNGQKISVLVIDDQSFYRDGTTVETGSLALDIALCVVGLMGIGIAVRSWMILSRRRRRAR